MSQFVRPKSSAFSSILISMCIFPFLLSCESGLNQTNEINTVIPTSSIKEEQDANDLPIDEAILKGQLNNGVQYIIRENSKPENFAELRLVVKAGSLNEDENQLGFAHFAEHMAFNGTEDFKQQEIVEFVESIGMKFGAHLNASTSFDRTIYKLRVPSDDPAIIEKAIHILENWAHKVSFNANDIDEERGVVLEEWRARKGVGERIAKQQWPIMFAGTNYHERLPIGTEKSITQGFHDDLRRFYETWYHPSLMSIVAVGDFDQQAIKVLIEKYFNKIPARDSISALKKQYLREYETPLVNILTDKELTSTNIAISWRNNQQEVTYNKAHYKQTVIRNVASSIIAKRLSDLGLDTQSAFTGPRLGYNQVIPTAQELFLRAGVKPGRLKEAFESLLLEIKRAIDHGVSEQELNTEKELYLEWFDSALASQNTFNHGAYIGSYVNHLISGAALTSLQQDYMLSKAFLAEIELGDIQQQLRDWANTKNVVVFVTAPEETADTLPSEDELSSLWQKVDESVTQKIQDKTRVTELLAELPKRGKVVEKQFNEQLQAHQWELSNGAVVIVKPTDFKENSILFHAVSDGGYASVDNDTYLSSFGMMSTLDFLGLGQLDMQALNQFSREKRFSLNTRVGEYTEALRGSSNLEDFELMMQSIYLRFTSVVKDQARFDWLKDTYRPRLEKKYNRPEAQFEAAIKAKTNSGDPRSVEFDVSMLERQSLDTIYEVYQQRFANAADFTFVFVGDIDLEAMTDYVELYIASLPSQDIREQRQKLPQYSLTGDVQVHMEKGDEPKARVIYSMFGEAQWSYENRQTLTALRSMLENSLRKRLREELAGVYSVSVNASIASWPYQEYSLGVSFTCDPQRIDELVDEIQVIFDDYKQGNIDGVLLDNYKTQAKTRRTKSLKENRFWMSFILSHFTPTPAFPLGEYETLVNNITLEDIQNAAKQYLQSENRLFATLKPENESEQSTETEATVEP